MRIASISLHEELRLQDLYSYDILNNTKEKDFDELLEVVAQIYGCPMATISFFDQERQWLKSRIGLSDAVIESAGNIDFCGQTNLSDEVLIVGDASKDERFCTNPLVTGEPGIRFYAGAPIVSARGYRLGAVSVIDKEPRDLRSADTKTLQILSRQISNLLELRLKNKLLREKAEEQMQLEKMLLQKVIQKHEVEKESISFELHEQIAQSLAATRFYLEMSEVEGIDNKDLVRKSRENVASLIRQVKELSQSIRPSLLQEVELKELLNVLTRQFQNQTGINIQLLYEGAGSVAAGLSLTIYRIVELQLQNIREHAKATTVLVNIHVFSAVYLSIKDDGIGFDSKTFQRGAGLTTILSNVEAMKGVVEITSSIKGGCELKVTLPRKA